MATPNPLHPAPATSVKTDPSTQTSELAVVTVSSRISEFWRDQPELWFLHTEAILAPQKLSDEHRFNLIVSKLSKDVLEQVIDLLRDPPAVKKFDALKARLISTYEESEAKQFEKLLSQMELGDQKPSQLLRKMRELAHDKINEQTLSMLWMRQLPSSVRGVLTVADTKNLETRAAMADKILETMRPMEVAELKTAASTSDNHKEIARLTARVNNLYRLVNEKPRYHRVPGPSRYYRTRSQSRPRLPAKKPGTSHGDAQPTPKASKPPRTCFYHAKYGDNAHKCIAPCNYNKTEN